MNLEQRAVEDEERSLSWERERQEAEERERLARLEREREERLTRELAAWQRARSERLYDRVLEAACAMSLGSRSGSKAGSLGSSDTPTRAIRR